MIVGTWLFGAIPWIIVVSWIIVLCVHLRHRRREPVSPLSRLIDRETAGAKTRKQVLAAKKREREAAEHLWIAQFSQAQVDVRRQAERDRDADIGFLDYVGQRKMYRQMDEDLRQAGMRVGSADPGRTDLRKDD